MNIVQNVRSARLSKVVKAATLVADLPTTTKRDLNDTARAVRLFIEAGTLAPAGDALDRLQCMAMEAFGAEEEALFRAISDCVDSLRPEVRS